MGERPVPKGYTYRSSPAGLRAQGLYLSRSNSVVILSLWPGRKAGLSEHGISATVTNAFNILSYTLNSSLPLFLLSFLPSSTHCLLVTEVLSSSLTWVCPTGSSGPWLVQVQKASTRLTGLKQPQWAPPQAHERTSRLGGR